MAWWQWLISLLCGLAGTALGGYISYKTMLTQLKNQHEIENERHIRQKREETYLQAIDGLLEYSMYEQNEMTQLIPYGIQKLNLVQSKIGVYASKDISDKYYKLVNMIRNVRDKEMVRLKIIEFTQDVKTELGIKDV